VSLLCILILFYLFLFFFLKKTIVRFSLFASNVLRHNALGLKGGSARVPMFQTGHGLPTKRPIPGVAHIVAVASGKGGVGKSTCAGDDDANRMILFLFFFFLFDFLFIIGIGEYALCR
jgi:hypothetical protein